MKISESDKKLIVDELQMLTGVQSDDVDFLYYCLIKDGSYFVEQESIIESDIRVQSLDDWFNSL